METLLLLLFAHALADYPLQGDFLSKAKNHRAPIPGVPWYQALVSHSAIHAGFVGVITGSIVLALAEFVVHTATDYAKCAGKISYNTDQAIHISCKVIWAIACIWWHL
ncbi:DUF3307 domain-containing protein [Phaeobacter sp. JH204B]|uniref:DUF3307 domain-containing protein n=1 Tax=Phaeobacter sp. JH204B TaxID=3112503 RepID=UPI003A8B21C2